MRKLLFLIFLLIFCSGIFSQDFEDLSFGADSTFEVMTWNIEWFPKNGQTTLDYVTEIIQALDVDVIAFQEIESYLYFELLVDNLEGWEGYFAENDYLSLAYIYKTENIVIHDIFEIYTNESREFPRSPLVIELSFMDEYFVIIDNHLKCCGDGFLEMNDPWDEETRRYDACVLLDGYINNNYPNNRVVVVGDMNDEITDDPMHNVFQTFINKPGKYLFADMEIAEGNSSDWSYPSWPSQIDHILVTNELFEEFEADGSYIQTIKLDEYFDGGFDEYEDNISDHRPVALKIDPNFINFGFNDVAISKNQLNCYPNPFKYQTTLSFDKASNNTIIDIYNIQGKKVYSKALSIGQSVINWNAENLPEGIYFAKIIADNQIIGISKLIHLR